MDQRKTIPEIEAMRMGVDYSFSISLRGFPVDLRPLSNSETMRAFSSVNTYVRGLPEFQRGQLVEDNAKAREFLKLASSQYGQPLTAKITDTVLDEATNDEIMYLYREWLAVCDKVNPNLQEMPVEHVKALVEEVKKNTPKDLASQLTELSFWQMRSILTYLLTNEESPTDSASGG